LISVNVCQQPCEKKLIEKVVCIRVVQLVWDHCVSLNPHALVVYLKLIHALRTRLENFDECYCKDDNVHIFYRTWVLSNGHYCWLKGLITSLLVE
jgi:hypothetical protein